MNSYVKNEYNDNSMNDNDDNVEYADVNIMSMMASEAGTVANGWRQEV